ncbi:MAG: thioredoxin [Asgard group archaeon]|nr:thioredoxin [Asgard group archaeon]
MDELEAIRAKKMKEMMQSSKLPSVPVKISDTTFNDVINESKLVVVDCWAEWCGPCKMIAPIIDKLAEEYSSKVMFAKLNVDENPQTTSKYGIMSIPTLLVFKSSKLVDTIVGAVPKLTIESILKKHM